MIATPSLATPRLRLEPFAPEHLTAGYVAWLNDPGTMRFSENRHRRHTRESCAGYVQSFAGSPHHLWAILAVDRGPRHIGNINAYVDPPNRVADIGILIGERACHGQGFGGEAWAAVQDWLLTAAGMRKVTGGAMADNLAMVAVFRRSGMHEEGRRSRQFLRDGLEVDLVYYARFAAP